MMAIVVALVLHHHGGLFEPLQHWIAVHTGTVNEGGPYYGWWSGFASDLGEYTIAISITAGVVHTFRRHNCGAKRCWRISRHPAADGAHRICTHHFKQLPGNEHLRGRHLRFEDIAHAHQDHLDRQKVTSE
jgi:hypothetical protein